MGPTYSIWYGGPNPVGTGVLVSLGKGFETSSTPTSSFLSCLSLCLCMFYCIDFILFVLVKCSASLSRNLISSVLQFVCSITLI